MGVPKFFRWISERYPKIVQRYGSRPVQETAEEHGVADRASLLTPPDPLSECTLAPEFDRLYIDMNGIIHGCSHNNSDDDTTEEGLSVLSQEQIFSNICYYLDRIIKDIAKPQELVYMAIDGVAPRAKLNQQRARRYRSGKEGEIEQTVYDAHQQAVLNQVVTIDVNSMESPSSRQLREGNSALKEVNRGRFTGKFETVDEADPFGSDLDDQVHSNDFHLNQITPGTGFFERCTAHIEHFIQLKLSTDPAWKNLTIVFSGPNVPGEGEHKIMQFMREQKSLPDYNPNLRHCIMGQDGDLIMLGLVTHEPNLALLRERVLFGWRRFNADSKLGVEAYMHNPNFEFLHMNILREYLSYEFETRCVVPNSPFDLERTIDDFVFMTFFVGNDFLPHMPALDIADEAFDLLFYSYRQLREGWLEDSSGLPPYLTDSGNIVSGKRLEEFLGHIGAHENPYYDNKKQLDSVEERRKTEAKFGMSTIPSDDVIESKETADRAKFRQMIYETIKESQEGDNPSLFESHPGFTPVLSSAPKILDQEDDSEENLFARVGRLLEQSVGPQDGNNDQAVPFDDQDLKGRYYHDKFGFSPFDADKHIALRKAYVEGLVWNLKYYYEGCVSWEWFYPYHYGPMLSDLVGLDGFLKEISFEQNLGEPLKPFEQLLACMPPSHAHVLPEPYRHLMAEDSPIADFYPRSFTIDMNGKRWPWEAVVLLPFIDSRRLREAVETVDVGKLTEDERRRNQFAHPTVYRQNPMVERSIPALSEGATFRSVEICTAEAVPFHCTHLHVTPGPEPNVFRPELKPGIEWPLPGFPTLKSSVVLGMWRKRLAINVHGAPSRYKTACLELHNEMPELFPIDQLAEQLLGSVVYINYPHYIEAFVTAISDDEFCIRGNDSPRRLELHEAVERQKVTRWIAKEYVFGSTHVGSGGVAMIGGAKPMFDGNILLNVRPFKGFKTMPDGTVVKTFAKFEVAVPLFVTSWKPRQRDPRLSKPVGLERDPFRVAKFVIEARTVKPIDDASTRPVASTLPKAQFARAFHTSALASTGSPHVSTISKPSARDFHTSASPLKNLPLRSDLKLLTTCVEVGDKDATARAVFSPNTVLRQRSARNGPIAAISSARGPRKLLVMGAAAAAVFMAKGVSASTLSPTVSAFDPSSFMFDHGFNRPKMMEEHNEDESPDWLKERLVESHVPPIQFAHGTTTLSFVFPGGIVAAVDSRASLGSFVGSKTTQKVLPVHSHLLATMAGGAADCSYWIRKLRAEAALFELQHRGDRMSVARASRMLSNWLYQRRGFNLSLGTMVMGFDDEARIYYVDNSGMRIEGDMFAVGSGSTYALGILDTERRTIMTAEEAVALGIKAIRHATFRDAYSGGFINVYLITREDGWKCVFSEDVAGAKLALEDSYLNTTENDG